jgi:Spy/CpxP family protein refolding chaperone
MKKQMILTAMCATLLLGGGMAVQAQSGPAQGREFDGISRQRLMCPQGDSAPKHRFPMLDRLDLSEAQQKEVQALLDGSIARSTKLHGKMREVGRQLRQAMEPGKFDEKALRKLASEKSAIETELMVERAKTHSRIYGLLTPEQKELADLASKLRRLQGHGPINPERHMPRPMCMEPMEAGPTI